MEESSEENSKMITEPFEQTDSDNGKEDKYHYVHEKLMTNDHWEKPKRKASSAMQKSKPVDNPDADADFGDIDGIVA